eukprot:g12857.t1
MAATFSFFHLKRLRLLSSLLLLCITSTLPWGTNAGKKVDLSLALRSQDAAFTEALDRSVMYLLEVLQLLFFDGDGLLGQRIFDPATGSRHFAALYRTTDGSGPAVVLPGSSTTSSSSTSTPAAEFVDVSYGGPQKEFLEKQRAAKREQDQDQEQRTPSAYPPDYIRFCFLGVGDSASVLLQRYMMIFPQFTYVLLDRDFDLDFLEYLQRGFPTVKMEVNYDETHSSGVDIASGKQFQEHEKCDVLAFGRDTPGFTFRKLQPLVKDPTVLLWLTDGCDPKSSIVPDSPSPTTAPTTSDHVKQQCQFTYSNWRSSMCGDPEDLMKSYGANPESMQALLDSKYGAYGACYRHVKDPKTQEESFEIASPVCVCAMMPDLVNDFYFEKANCAQFSDVRGLPAGKRILGRNTENWYDPKKDWFLGFGQWNQDWFLFQNFFRNQILRHTLVGASASGVYIDIGAMGANTAVFDQCFGWKGICVEPNPAQHYILRNYRSCSLEPRAVGGKTGEAKQFSLEFAGSAGHLRERSVEETAEIAFDKAEEFARWTNSTSRATSGPAAARPASAAASEDFTRFLHSTFSATSVSLEDLLRQHGAAAEAGAPAVVVDLVSIDVEGGEFDILKDYPFDKDPSNGLPRINVFLIETDAKSVFKMDILMLEGGYAKVAQIGKDQVYVHREFLQQLAYEVPPPGAGVPQAAVEDFVNPNAAERKVIATDAEIPSPSNPFELTYPPYINIEPYNDTFAEFQKRFLDPEFGG